MRETFLLPLTGLGEKGVEFSLNLMVHQIVAIMPEKDSTKILVSTGLVYTVKENLETITRATKAVGTMVDIS